MVFSDKDFEVYKNALYFFLLKNKVLSNNVY